MNRTSDATDETRRDFFVSYTGANSDWAQWVSWELEEAGYTTVLQAWDFAPGTRFVQEMQTAISISRRTIALLSEAYISSSFAAAEWQEAWRLDPTGDERKLLVFRVEDCVRPGILGQLVSVDLFGVDEQESRSRLLQAVREGRHKPELPPGFPAAESPSVPQPFPGRLIEASVDEAMKAGGPLERDNPFAVALAFWHAALTENTDQLNNFVTPESRDRWNIAEVLRQTEDGGLTTGVMKPCYDVAYVRIVSDVSAEVPAYVVAGGLVQKDARIISLVYRPELGGWRVHSLGYPLDADELPRTWHFN